MIINKLEKVIALGAKDTTLGNFRLYIEEEQFRIDHDGQCIYKYYYNNDGLDLMSLFNEEYGFKYTYDWRKPLCGMVDFMYNYHNFDFKFKNGKVKTKWIQDMAKRHKNDNEYPFTDWLLNKLLEAGTTLEDINKYLPGWRAIQPRKLTNYTDNSTFYYRSAQGIDLNGDYAIVPRHIDLTAMGYIFYEQWGWFTPDVVMVDVDGTTYPSYIAQRKFKICKTCGQRASKLFAKECSVCLGVDPDLIQIRGYSDRAPAFLKFKEGKYSKALYKEPLYLGVELEMECDDNVDSDLVYAAKTLGTHCIFKRDGSIRNGFEIVSTPATLDIHKQEFKPFFDNVVSQSTLMEAASVGMHVHVSRKPLSILTIGKMTEFMNLIENKPYLEKIAGRWSDRFAGQEGRSITFAFRNQAGGERYNALNLRNKETVEFRIFASTRVYDEFVMRLEFCEALTHYCSPCQSKATSLKDIPKWFWFVQYVLDNAKAWPYLSKFIKGL